MRSICVSSGTFDCVISRAASVPSTALPSALRDLFLSEMAALGDALLALTTATRINYAMFGNVEPALHAHIFPRRSTEPEATRTAQPWALDWDSAPGYCDALHGDLKRALTARLTRVI